jgi:hypothetical protein
VKQETLKVLADSSNILTASTGVGTSAWGALEYWDFVNTNAAGIGVLLTFVFGIVAICFNTYNSIKLSKADKNERVIDNHGERLESHIQETRDGLDEILRKLNKD